jgi:hypothetical protein
MALSTDRILGIALAILIVIIVIIVIMVLISNAMRARADANDPVIPIILPCFKPCGCHCQRACNCQQNNSSGSSTTDSTSSTDCNIVKYKREHQRKNSSSSSSSGYSCTPDSSSSSSSSSVAISSESISDDSSVSSISFDRKPCPSSDSSSSSSSDYSPFKARIIPDSSSSDSKQCHTANGYALTKPEAPKLNCVALKDSKFMATCGRADSDSFIQWYPESGVDKYTVYVKAGKGGVSPTEFDSKYEVAATHNYFLTPKLAAGPHSFVVTASRFNLDGTEAQSEPSDTFMIEK